MCALYNRLYSHIHSIANLCRLQHGLRKTLKSFSCYWQWTRLYVNPSQGRIGQHKFARSSRQVYNNWIVNFQNVRVKVSFARNISCHRLIRLLHASNLRPSSLSRGKKYALKKTKSLIVAPLTIAFVKEITAKWLRNLDSEGIESEIVESFTYTLLYRLKFAIANRNMALFGITWPSLLTLKHVVLFALLLACFNCTPDKGLSGFTNYSTQNPSATRHSNDEIVLAILPSWSILRYVTGFSMFQSMFHSWSTDRRPTENILEACQSLS